MHLDEEIVVLDLAGWRRERMPELPDTAGEQVNAAGGRAGRVPRCR